ncbi:histone deacetylase domain-containing protein [Gautieria morchelliformis]|nr:histone deacetylase domain-containing protein [Gautieria morchelliformis]
MSPQATVFFQDKCLSHRYIRSHDTSTIFERPQRLRAVKIGVAAAIARLEELREKNVKGSSMASSNPDDLLSTALQRLNLAEQPGGGREDVLEVVMSTASVDLLNHPAVKYVHGDVDGDVYLERLVALVQESEGRVERNESEIPEDLSQTDLYLCGESLDAIQGAIGTVCEAVDAVFEASLSPSSETLKHPPSKRSTRAFVAIRPPGHHCGEDTPSGFCFVNNVAIAAAHAHLKHGVTRVIVLDIDLHHGNGTQSIVWQINEEAYRQDLESEEEEVRTSSPSPLRVYYGSIHDPLSYPCEGGNAAIIQAASVSIHGPHGQHIENVHLVPYQSEADFWDRLYSGSYRRLLDKAEGFLQDHDENSGEVMVFISAGFDASEHETASMSRHARKLPTGFFKKFTRDVRTLADKYAKGRIVSVLEGGYSDRALCSGAMAHVLGLVEEAAEVDESWWSVENLAKIEKATKKRRGGRTSTTTSDRWTERILSLLTDFDPNPSPPPTPKPIPPSTMTLRDRSKKADSMSASSSESGTPSPQQSRSAVGEGVGRRKIITEDETAHQGITPAEKTLEAPAKKLPKVRLVVNPPPGSERPPS